MSIWQTPSLMIAIQLAANRSLDFKPGKTTLLNQRSLNRGEMMEKIYHYAISLHTETPPNTNLIKAHEKGAVYIGADFKPTIHENHLMIPTRAVAEQIIEKLKPAIVEKYGNTANMQIIYDSAQANDKQKGRKAEHEPLIEAFLA